MKNNGRVLAIDFGTKRIGVAISDENRILARPLCVIAQSPNALAEILSLVERNAVSEVLLGLPLSLAGEDTPMTKAVRAFGAKLFENLSLSSIPHGFYDERFTSVIAHENIARQDLRQKKRRQRGIYDEEAARIMLQEYLDRS